MSTVFQKYAAALLPFFILVVGASQTVLKDPIDWNAVVTFAILVLGAIVTFIVPLVQGTWQGRLKTGVAIVTAILAALLPFILPGGFNAAFNVPVIIVAILNAIATELGVQIRKDQPISPTASVLPDPKSVPAS